MTHETPADRARRMLKSAGYADGGDVGQDKRIVKKAIGQHDKQLHGGKHTQLNLRRGGTVDGTEPGERPDRKKRGGGLKAVNVVLHQGDPQREQSAARQGLQQGIRAGAALGARSAARGIAGPPPGINPPLPPGGGAALPSPVTSGLQGRPPLKDGGKAHKMRSRKGGGAIK